MSFNPHVVRLDDGSGFFVGIVDINRSATVGPVYWNPYNKVVSDHHDGTIDHEKTNRERAARGLPVPWTPDLGGVEVHEPPVW